MQILLAILCILDKYSAYKRQKKRFKREEHQLDQAILSEHPWLYQSDQLWWKIYMLRLTCIFPFSLVAISASISPELSPAPLVSEKIDLLLIDKLLVKITFLSSKQYQN